MRGVIHATLLAAAGLACGVPGLGCAAMPEGDRPARVELGAGERVFEPLPEDGATLGLVHGPQGGFHVVVAARLDGLDPEGATLRYDARDPETDRALVFPATLLLTPARLERDGAAFVHLGGLAIFDVGGPDEITGRTVALGVHVVTRDGDMFEDWRAVSVVDGG